MTDMKNDHDLGVLIKQGYSPPLRLFGNSPGEKPLVGGVSDGDRATLQSQSPTESPPTTSHSRTPSDN